MKTLWTGIKVLQRIPALLSANLVDKIKPSNFFEFQHRSFSVTSHCCLNFQVNSHRTVPAGHWHLSEIYFPIYLKLYNNRYLTSIFEKFQFHQFMNFFNIRFLGCLPVETCYAITWIFHTPWFGQDTNPWFGLVQIIMFPDTWADTTSRNP